jgi:hypothetical protein
VSVRYKKKSLAMKRRWKDPAYREHMAAARAALNGTNYMTPEGRRSASEKALKRWKDASFRKRLSKRMSAGAKARWADKVKREALLKVRNKPEAIARNIATRQGNLAKLCGITIEQYRALNRYKREALVKKSKEKKK